MLKKNSKNGSQPPDNSTSTLEFIIGSIPNGRRIAMSYARQISLRDDDERWRALVAAYDADKKADLGELCREHEIEPADFMAEINREMFPVTEQALEFAKGLSTKIVAARLPKVVERGLIEASKADGITDRHFILQKEGFHTAPKGVNIQMNQVNQQAAGLPSFEDETKSLANILSDDHQLTEGTQDYAEAVVEEDLQEVA